MCKTLSTVVNWVGRSLELCKNARHVVFLALPFLQHGDVNVSSKQKVESGTTDTIVSVRIVGWTCSRRTVVVDSDPRGVGRTRIGSRLSKTLSPRGFCRHSLEGVNSGVRKPIRITYLPVHLVEKKGLYFNYVRRTPFLYSYLFILLPYV